MPRAVVDADIPVPVDIEPLRGRRSALDVEVVPSDTLVDRPIDADILITSNGSWDDRYLSGLGPGDWVQTIGAGYDRFPIDRFAAEGIMLTNAPGIHDQSAGEHVMALMLSFARRLHEFRDAQRDRRWDRVYGTELAERRVTILGMGNIGEAIAARARAFDMDVRAIKRDVDAYEGRLDAEQLATPDGLDALLPSTDYLVVVLPLTDSTRNLVDEATFAALPDSAVLINIARGGVVDETALVDALERGTIAGAGLDVFESEPLPAESPLWTFENAVLTPHLAGVSDRYMERFADVFLSMYDSWVAADPLEHRVV
jgi:D-2-hydroxyacid dehydrogenase (NADP+)